MMLYPIESICEAFGEACGKFEALVHVLHSDKTARMEHGLVESLIFGEGMEIQRLLMQAYLDMRAVREPRRFDLCTADYEPLTRCREGCERKLETLFGEVTVRRKGYNAAGVGKVFALDGEMNLPRDKYSHELRRRIAEEASMHSFDETVKSIDKATGGHVPKRQAEEVTIRVSEDFDAFYASRKQNEPACSILVGTVDSKGIVMRREDLRPATRKAAEQEPRHSGARLGPGEKANRKRMATVASVYSVEPYERTPESVMDRHKSADRPRAVNKRVWASAEKDAEEVIRALFGEALRRDPQRKRPWVILVDGGEQQLSIILSYLTQHQFYDVTLVLDFIHVLEYVWKAAYCFHPVGSGEAEEWVAKQALSILQGEAADVARTMKRAATCQRLSSRKAVDTCADYLLKYLPMLGYREYLSQGFPIATGVIEGACRHLIKDRMDITGARWKLRSAEAILRIRSLRSSGDFDDYWAFHLAREHQRNQTVYQRAA